MKTCTISFLRWLKYRTTRDMGHSAWHSAWNQHYINFTAKLWPHCTLGLIPSRGIYTYWKHVASFASLLSSSAMSAQSRMSKEKESINPSINQPHWKIFVLKHKKCWAKSDQRATLGYGLTVGNTVYCRWHCDRGAQYLNVTHDHWKDWDNLKNMGLDRCKKYLLQ